MDSSEAKSPSPGAANPPSDGFIGQLRRVLSRTFASWSAHDVPSMGAALAYYAAFSMAPVLVIVISILTFWYGEESSARVFEEFSDLVGPDGARLVQRLVENAKASGSGIGAAVTGTVAVLVGASGLFAQIQHSLNKIWEVPPSPDAGWKRFFLRRIVSFSMVIAIALVLLASFLVTAAASGVEHYLVTKVPVLAPFTGVSELAVSFLVLTIVFVIMFKALPDAETRWSEVWVGSVVTALLFATGKYLIALYLGRSSVASPYGAAGSLVGFLVWVYYSSQVFFLGAEFTRAYGEESRPGAAPPAEGTPETSEDTRRAGNA